MKKYLVQFTVTLIKNVTNCLKHGSDFSAQIGAALNNIIILKKKNKKTVFNAIQSKKR